MYNFLTNHKLECMSCDLKTGKEMTEIMTIEHYFEVNLELSNNPPKLNYYNEISRIPI